MSVTQNELNALQMAIFHRCEHPGGVNRVITYCFGGNPKYFYGSVYRALTVTIGGSNIATKGPTSPTYMLNIILFVQSRDQKLVLAEISRDAGR